MTPEQVRLVQSTFAQVEPIAETAADLFYTRLFELDPSLRPMFTGDMTEQGQKLMRMIGIVVNNLTRLETILTAITRLGQKHTTYGVRAQHYDTVAVALLWTLEKGLGGSWNAEVQEAWTVAYTTLAGVMKDAASAAA